MMNVVNRIENTLRGVDNFLNNFGTGIMNLGSIDKGKTELSDNELRKELLQLHGVPLSDHGLDDYSYLDEEPGFTAVA